MKKIKYNKNFLGCPFFIIILSNRHKTRLKMTVASLCFQFFFKENGQIIFLAFKFLTLFSVSYQFDRSLI